MRHSLLARLPHRIGIVVALCLACDIARSNRHNNALLIEHVTLIDSTGAVAKDDVSVLIGKKSRIGTMFCCVYTFHHQHRITAESECGLIQRAKASVDAKPNKSDYLSRRSHTRI